MIANIKVISKIVDGRYETLTIRVVRKTNEKTDSSTLSRCAGEKVNAKMWVWQYLNEVHLNNCRLSIERQIGNIHIYNIFVYIIISSSPLFCMAYSANGSICCHSAMASHELIFV